MTLDEIKEVCDVNRKNITAEAERDAGKLVRMDGNGKPALLLTAVDGTDDFYWFAMYPDLTTVLSSCVGGYEVIEGEIPPELSIIKWLQDNDPKGLMERVIKETEKFGDDITLLAPIKVN